MYNKPPAVSHIRDTMLLNNEYSKTLKQSPTRTSKKTTSADIISISYFLLNVINNEHVLLRK